MHHSRLLDAMGDDLLECLLFSPCATLELSSYTPRAQQLNSLHPFFRTNIPICSGEQDKNHRVPRNTICTCCFNMFNMYVVYQKYSIYIYREMLQKTENLIFLVNCIFFSPATGYRLFLGKRSPLVRQMGPRRMRAIITSSPPQ